MNQGKLANWLKTIVGLMVISGKAILGFSAIIALFAIVLTLFGGKIGPISATVLEWRLLFPAILGAALIGFGAIYIGKRLRDIFASLEIGDPFIDSNAVNLRQIAFCLAVMEIGRYFIKLITLIILKLFGQPNEGIISIAIDPSFIAWGAVLVLFILSEVFKEGARLRKNDQLTI